MDYIISGRFARLGKHIVLTMRLFSTAGGRLLQSADARGTPADELVEGADTALVKSGQGRFTVNGNLVMHGITKSVTLDAEGPAPEQADLTRGTFVAGFVGKTTLARKDFGLTQGGPLLAYDVPVELDIELSRPRD